MNSRWEQILEKYNKVPFVEGVDSRNVNDELAQCMMMDHGLRDLIDADELIYGMPQYYWKALASKLKFYEFLRHETEKIMDAYAGEMWNLPDGENRTRLHRGVLDSVYTENGLVEETKEEVDVRGLNRADEIAAYVWSTADYITKTKNIVTFSDNGEIRAYADGIYPSKKIDYELQKIIADTALRLFGCRFLTGQISNTLDRIKYITAVDRESFDSDKYTIVLRNGVLNLKNMEFLPHDPKHKYMSKIDVQYDPRYTEVSESFEYYLRSTFAGCESQIDVIQELFGYCLLKEYTFEHFFFMIGGGANGKTTLMNILSKLIGESNISNLSLHDIIKPRDDHVLCDLYGKMVNICGEIGTGKIYDSRNLKIVTGRDKIRTRQLYQESFSFYNYAKIIFSMNEAPVIEDFTDAFKRRVVIVDFPNQFNKGEEGTRTDIEAECTTEESLSSILNWAISGLKRLLENGVFSDQKSNALKGLAYDMKSNPIEYFVQDRVVDDVDGYLLKVDVLEEYVSYAKKNNLPILTKTKFNLRFIDACKNIGIETKIKQLSPSIDKSRPSVYINIGFREPERLENKELERDVRTFYSNNLEIKKYDSCVIADKFLEVNSLYNRDDILNFVTELKKKEWITRHI